MQYIRSLGEANQPSPILLSILSAQNIQENNVRDKN
jgi:hypothetical protein